MPAPRHPLIKRPLSSTSGVLAETPLVAKDFEVKAGVQSIGSPPGAGLLAKAGSHTPHRFKKNGTTVPFNRDSEFWRLDSKFFLPSDKRPLIGFRLTPVNSDRCALSRCLF